MGKREKNRLAAALCAHVFAVTITGAAAAQTNASPASAPGVAVNSAAAQALFDDARKLMASGNLGEACPKFEESQRLDPGSGTLMNLAVCYERQGRTASAWTTYIEAGNLAKANGKPDRARAAEGKAAALSPKLARLTIRVASGKVASLEVQRDSIVVRSPMWGTAIPLDPGAHRIVATAPGRKGWQTGVDPLFRTG